MGRPQSLFTELTRWRDKAAKRGKACTFKSNIIPDWLNAEIVAAMETVGHVKAFSFLKQAEPGRMAAERRLKRKIKKVLAKFEEKVARAVRQGKDPDYDKLFEELRVAVQPEIAALAVDNALRTSADVGIVFDPTIINQQAVEWARNYSYELVTGLTDTTRKLVSGVAQTFVETPGMTQADIEKLLAPAFGSVRAEVIATTEVTRAYSEATNETQRLVNQTGLQMTRVWHTANDDIVCPICGPLNGKPESGWRGEFPDGPPAHPNCRCGTGLSTLGDEFHEAEAAELAREREAMLRELGKLPPAPVAEVVSGIPITFDSRESADQWLTNTRSLNPALTTEQKTAIAEYKGDKFLDINDALRESGYTDEGVEDIIDSAFEGTSTPEPVTVWRGIDYEVFEDFDDLTDDIWGDDAYVSTSLNRRIAERFSDGIIVEIRVPQGARAINMEQWQTTMGSESELLLPRGSQFRVISDTGVDEDPREMVWELIL